MTDREPDLPGGRHQGLLLVEAEAPARRQRQDAGEAEDARGQQEPAVDQAGRAVVPGDVGGHAQHGDHQVHHAGDAAAAVVGEAVGADEAADVEVLGQLVADLAVGGRLRRVVLGGGFDVSHGVGLLGHRQQARRPASRARPSGHAARTLAALSGSDSGITRTPATLVMKFVSPFQRGSTWTWRWRRHAGAGRAPEVHADVQPVGPVGGPQGGGRVGDADPELGVLGRGELVELAHLAVGHDQHVPVRVREGVEDGEAVLAPPDDVGLLVGQARVEDAPEDRPLTFGLGRGAWSRTRCASRPRGARGSRLVATGARRWPRRWPAGR